MGWVGVGALIAAACFLLYHQYPSRSGVPEPSSAPPPESISANAPAASEEAGKETEKPKSPVTEEPLPGDKNKEEEENTEEAESTPKASASAGPTIEVPPLRLNGDINSIEDSVQIKKPPSNTAKMSPMPPPQPPAASSSSLMPPPPLPRPRQQNQQSQTEGRYPPRPNGDSFLRPSPSAASSLRPPPSASSTLSPPPSAASSLRVPSTGRPPTNSLSPKPGAAKPSSSKRAIIEPGFSQLDWAALKSNPNNNLRGADLPPNLIKVTPSMLKAQNGRKGRDAWTSYQGKVYNISPYLPYHPGGKGELMRGAGKDSAKLFFEIHPWVNWEAILGECLVGILVSENDTVNENALDAMD